MEDSTPPTLRDGEDRPCSPDKPISKKPRVQDAVSSEPNGGVDNMNAAENSLLKQTTGKDTASGNYVKEIEDNETKSIAIKKRKVHVESIQKQDVPPEVHARERLKRYLDKRNFDMRPDEFLKIKIEAALRPNKIAGGPYEEENYILSYELNGTVYATRGQLFEVLSESRPKPPSSLRRDAQLAASRKLGLLHLPADFYDSSSNLEVQLIQTGQLVPDLCSLVQLYPVGYKACIFVNKGSLSERKIICEIDRSGKGLEFSISFSVSSLSRVTGHSEENAWKLVTSFINANIGIYFNVSSIISLIP
jgi:hypothetical protein